jgi:hypothetical protein
MNLKRRLFSWRTAHSDGGGVINDEPFYVKMRFRRLIYSEGDHTLTVHVEPLLGRIADCAVDITMIRHWDGSQEALRSDQIFIIKQNIFAALDFLKIRDANVR